MSTAENITFMVIRGFIALAIVGLGFYCVAQGIHLFALPRAEAEQIRIHFIGLDITASELGAVIFAVGLAVCYVGQRTAPMRIETAKGTPLWTQTRPEILALPEITAVLDALQRTAMRLQPAKAKEGIGMSVAEGHMAIPTAARQLPSVRRTSESITPVQGTRNPPTAPTERLLRSSLADWPLDSKIMRAYIVISTEGGKSREVARQIAGLPGVKMADACWGSRDVFAIADVGGTKELNKLVTDKIQRLQGVRETNTHIALD